MWTDSKDALQREFPKQFDNQEASQRPSHKGAGESSTHPADCFKSVTSLCIHTVNNE